MQLPRRHRGRQLESRHGEKDEFSCLLFTFSIEEARVWSFVLVRRDHALTPKTALLLVSPSRPSIGHVHRKQAYGVVFFFVGFVVETGSVRIQRESATKSLTATPCCIILFMFD